MCYVRLQICRKIKRCKNKISKSIENKGVKYYLYEIFPAFGWYRMTESETVKRLMFKFLYLNR